MLKGKILSSTLKTAVFNDTDYRMLSSDRNVSITDLKTFDKNKGLYNVKAYKIKTADKAMDLGFYKEKILKNGKTRNVKFKAVIPQKIIITFSRKMIEYQRFIRNCQIERARIMLNNLDPETYKKGGK